MSTKRDKPMTERDFAAKVEWEGGITGALDYGLKAEDCEPGELRTAWEKLELKWAAIQEEIDDVQAVLDQYQENPLLTTIYHLVYTLLRNEINPSIESRQ